MARWRLSMFFVVCVILTFGVHAQDTITLLHPIAYIGHDDNLYLTDGTTTLPITSDAAMDELGQGIQYDQPRWSPDGVYLLFWSYSTREGRTLMLLESGQPVRELVAEKDGLSFIDRHYVWSPDGHAIALIGNDSAADNPFGLLTISVEDGAVDYLAPALSPGLGEGGDIIDPAISLTTQESGRYLLTSRFEVAWSEAGLVFGAAESCFCLALVTPEGEQIKEWSPDTQVISGTDGTHLLLMDADGAVASMLSLDGDNETSLAGLPETAHPVAVTDGSLLYSTRTVDQVVDAILEQQTGVPIVDQFTWSFNAEHALLTLWRHIPDADDEIIFETEGYNFGVVRPTADGKLLVSVIPSNVEVVTALNNGATPEEVQDALARPITYLLEAGEVVLTIDGGQPDYNGESFTITATP